MCSRLVRLGDAVSRPAPPTSVKVPDLSVVVLLDEADVFLEERTLADQKRNATISSKSTPDGRT